MSRTSKINLGEPYQVYSEVTDAGKNVKGSKKKIRWLIGFSEREGEIEIALIHSVVSGKKTVFEDGREITSSTNMLATDFGHTWRSETCPGRLFRVEFATSMTTDPTIYTFMVDGIKFVDMPKKGSIGGGGDHRKGSYTTESSNQPRTINGFGGGAPSTARASTTNAGRASGTNASASGFGSTAPAKQEFGAPAAPAPHANRRFIYGDEEDGEEEPAKPAAAFTPAPAAGAPRGNFQSPFAPTNTATNSNAGFGFDPFSESPAPAPAAKSSAAGSLFNAFEESPPQAKATNKNTASFDPFGADPFSSAADPFATPAAAAAPAARRTDPPKVTATTKATPPQAPKPAPVATPNFFDDDYAAPAPAPKAAPANDFDAFAPSSNITPARRSSAVEISQDFAGMSFAPAPPKPSPAAQLFAPSEPEPEEVAPPAPEPVSKDPWAAGNNLVNLDFTGAAEAPRRASVTNKGPSLASMMTSPGGGAAGAPGSMGMGMGAAPVNSRASFTAGSPDMFGSGAVPMVPSMGGMGNANPRASFNAGPMGGMGGAPMGGMGGNPVGGMGAGPMGGMNNMNSRASFTAGPGAMGGMGGMGGAPMGGNMGMGGAPAGPMGAMNNTRGSFVSAQPPSGAMGGFGAPAPAPAKSSLDTLDWNM